MKKLLLLAPLFLFATPAFASTCAINSPQTANNNGGITTTYKAQAFTVSTACTPTSLAFFIGGDGSGTTANVTIRSNSGSSPSSVIATGSTISFGTTQHWAVSTFSSAPQLQTGTTYWAVYSFTGTSGETLGVNTNSSFALAKQSDNGSTWSNYGTTNRLAFDLEGTFPAPPPPPPTSSWMPDAFALLATVTLAVQTTAIHLWPMFALIGVVIAFEIAKLVVTFIRKSTKKVAPVSSSYKEEYTPEQVTAVVNKIKELGDRDSFT